MYVCVYMIVCDIHMCMGVCISVHLHMCLYRCMSECICMCVHVHMSMCVCIVHVYVGMPVCVHASIFLYLQVSSLIDTAGLMSISSEAVVMSSPACHLSPTCGKGRGRSLRGKG